ncbi:MAG: TlpA family protein disulfide reductase [Bacteroidales bacterium]|nr:TlpA family protein disulfide reductase [Bacteroidales bacterium]MBO7647892.1 TlpA family protein disulfide reductase [Bacteroidales bacterium]MCR4857582.1 TlpA family protein disulfide reductase [Bacteroidales bacterium]
MKNSILLTTIILAFCLSLGAQNDKTAHLAKLPAVDIQTIDGKIFNTQDIQNDGKPVIVSLWATWCKPCIAELLAIADEYEDWVEETGVKLYAVSIDDAKTSARVAPFVQGRGWDYEVLLDVNSDFKRAMNVNDVPYMCILNGKGEIVWQHTSYAPGSEQEVYEIIKSLAAEK